MWTSRGWRPSGTCTPQQRLRRSLRGSEPELGSVLQAAPAQAWAAPGAISRAALLNRPQCLWCKTNLSILHKFDTMQRWNHERARTHCPMASGRAGAGQLVLPLAEQRSRTVSRWTGSSQCCCTRDRCITACPSQHDAISRSRHLLRNLCGTAPGASTSCRQASISCAAPCNWASACLSL